MTAAGFPHSDTPGSQLGCQLPRAYRRLQRPSSALDAKASTMCPLQLAKHKHSTKTTKTHTTKTNTHTQHTHQPQNKPGSGRTSAGDARVHYPEIKQQEVTRPNSPGIHPDRVLMSQNPNSVLENPPPPRRPPFHAPTDPRASSRTAAAVLGNPHNQRQVVRRRLHYPNTTMAHRTLAGSTGVCSLERR